MIEADAARFAKLTRAFPSSSEVHFINALIDAVHHRSDILVILLDNGTTALTGLQPHPGIPRNARGEEAPAVGLQEIIGAMPIEFFRVIDAFDKEGSKPVLREGLTRTGLGVIIARGLCPLLPS